MKLNCDQPSNNLERIDTARPQAGASTQQAYIMALPQYKVVDTDGAHLKVWSLGEVSNPLLLLLPGGAGDGAVFDDCLPLLSKSFFTVCYDRRGCEGSWIEERKTLNPAQSARDTKAVIDSFGRDKAIIFASLTSGAIAFQFAVKYPSYVEHLIAHECLTLSLLPDSGELLDFAFDVYTHYQTAGPRAALAMIKERYSAWQHILPKGALHRYAFFYEKEWIMLNIWMPNLRYALDGGASIAVAVGEETNIASAEVGTHEDLHARCVEMQSRIWGLRKFIWKGGAFLHTSDPKAFVKCLEETLEEMKKDKKSKAQQSEAEVNAKLEDMKV